MPELALAVSATTTGAAPGRGDGVHYWFISDEEFDRRLAEDDFLEYYAFPWGQRSGTLRSELDRIARPGQVAVARAGDERRARRHRSASPSAVPLFITARFEELERRLRERATESAGEIEERLALSRRQLDQAEQCDFLIVNDEVERAAEELSGIVRRALDGAATMPT